MAVGLDQFIQFIQPWLGFIRAHALLAGALFIAAGFLIGILGRGFAYIVLLVGGISVGSVTLGQFGQFSDVAKQVADPSISGLVVLVTSFLSAFVLYKAAKFLLYPMAFLAFLSGWFLVFYQLFGFEFTTDPVKIAAWLLLSASMLLLTARAGKTLLANRISPKWKIPRRTPTKFLRRAVWARDDGICRLCGLPVDPYRWDLAHDKAYSKGGPLTVANTYVAHPDCNRSIGTMTRKEALRSVGR
jgi:hypothetical protein